MDTNGARAYSTPSEQEPSPEEALHRLLRQIAELQAYLTHFVSAKVDSVVLSARQLVMWAVLGTVGLLALAGLLITAIVLFLQGASAGLARLFHTGPWLGQLVVGVVIILLLLLGMVLGVRTWQRRWRQQKVQQYDERQLQQRDAFGHSVADRAAGTAL